MDVLQREVLRLRTNKSGEFMDRLDEEHKYRVPDDEWLKANGGVRGRNVRLSNNSVPLINTMQVCLFGSNIVNIGWVTQRL